MITAGTVDERFEPLRAAFERNFTDGHELGAALCVYADGREVADLWGGIAIADQGSRWRQDTLMVIRSQSKGVLALCALMLAERGQLDLDAPVAEYWSEFAAEGKGAIPVSWLLSHRAGLPALERWITLEEALRWEPVVDALAAQRPLWEPGTKHGYHALTYGFLVGEVIWRVSSRSPGTFVADEVAQQLDLDLWIGLPHEHFGRVAHMVQPTLPDDFDPSELPESTRRFIAAARDPDSSTNRALHMTQPRLDDADPRVWAAEVPAHNGVATARAVARMYAATIGDVAGARLLRPATVTDATRTRSDGMDEVILRPTRWGLGFALDSPFAPYGAPAAFGHPGAGGSLSFADPERGVAFAYVMNRMWAGSGPDPRVASLVEAVNRCV